jgi:vacuolar-type H+-ATPase subunit E/Vma4
LPESDDLAGFKKALLAQHKERCLVLKRSVDEDLADMITARRIEVERIVYTLRRSREKRFDEGSRANRRHVELQKKAFKIELQDRLFGHLEKKVHADLAALRRSPRYEGVMRALITEALEILPFPSIVWVEKGDSVFLEPGGNVSEIREGLEDVWGGLLVEAKEGGRLVDNTFRTRWERLRPFFITELGNAAAALFE